MKNSGNYSRNENKNINEKNTKNKIETKGYLYISDYCYLKKLECEISIWVIHDICTGIWYRIP